MASEKIFYSLHISIIHSSLCPSPAFVISIRTNLFYLNVIVFNWYKILLFDYCATEDDTNFIIITIIL